MSIVEFVAQLRDAGVRLYFENGRFKCSAPAGVLTAELRARIQERKAELIRFLANTAASSALGEPARRSESGPAPLSPAQRRLWFLEQLLGPSPTYNVPAAIRLIGDLQPEVLVRTLREMTRRHGALRTTFAEHDGEPVQIVHDDFVLEVPIADCDEASLAARFDGFARQPFDLVRGPLVRATLLRIDATHWALLLNLHHIVCDGWSMGIMMREIGALYGAFAQGQASPLPELALQYADYAHWQKDTLESDLLRARLEHWSEQLRGIPELLTLPMRRPRPRIQRHRGDRVDIALSLELTAKLHALADGAHATLYMVLLTAYGILLSRYSGQSTVGIGSPMANRPRTALEAVVGFFVNTLVMKFTMTGNPTARQLLARVRETTLQALAHQSVPFDAIVEAVSPTRNLGHTPLFQAEFALQNTPAAAMSLPGLRLELAEDWSGVAKFDLSLSMLERDGVLEGRFEYDTDLFHRADIERMALHFKELLRSMVATPELPVSRLGMLEPRERKQILGEWNRTEVRRGEDQPALVHQCFEMQALRYPDVIALEVGDRALTYRALNARANQYAHFFMARGVGAESLVGVCLQRSSELFAVILGILKAGGAYVPLDPSYPRERLERMASDAGLRLILSETALADDVTGLSGDVVCVDAPEFSLSGASTANPCRELHPFALAYVMYTSGSTGVPKGVSLPHSVLTNLMHWYPKPFASLAGERTLQFASASFDVSFEELATTWNTGGTLVVASEEERLDPRALLRFLAARAIHRTILPVVVVQHLAQELAEQGGPILPLRQLLTSGSQLQYSSEIRDLLHAMPGCELHNNYGPAETHAVLRHPMRGDPASWPALPPVGRPIDNTTFYILDAHGELVPPLARGELHLGGVAVGRGYIHRPGLTAERFLPDRFGSVPGGRLYRTGDLVRSSDDGCVEWLGRGDSMVKIRGCRVEPGEIETALGQHPCVRDVVVVAATDPDGSLRLAAYYTTNENDVGHADLRAFASRQLPPYMVPSVLQRVDAIPLGPNGKVDIAALPSPYAKAGGGSDHAPPRTETETALVAIWTEVMRLGSIGVHDDFFECGGHSLMAAQVVSRVRRTFQLEVPVRLLFEAPTIARFAEQLDLLRLAGEVCEEPAEPTDDDDADEWSVGCA